ncbi:hypothetical protein C4565_01385 [Candidatus Parcubacteria bacterium]|nr:MAG: hypothetical protein C4565_01385 [Candidatus Parcubacteria bacterium]
MKMPIVHLLIVELVEVLDSPVSEGFIDLKLLQLLICHLHKFAFRNTALCTVSVHPFCAVIIHIVENGRIDHCLNQGMALWALICLFALVEFRFAV